MVTNKKLFGGRVPLALLMAALALAFAAGCTPRGPRTLLQGKRLLEQGKFEAAAVRLTLATQLMPTNAQAWNYLGVASHQAGQPAVAAEAYQKALKHDRDLAIAHYNWGCLLLEQNKLDGARNELTAYTLREGNSVAGWLKLGVAQMRLRELPAAEKSFREAVRLNPENAEALNGLGMVQAQQNRQREALTCFNRALARQPNYGPALLNLAVVSHGFANTRQVALQRYQEYLALTPRAANWEAVNAVARQLEQELSPPSRPVAVAPVSPPADATRSPASNSTRTVTAPAMTARPDAATNPPARPAVSNTIRPVAVAEPAVKPDVVRLQETPVVKVAENRVTAPASNATAQSQPEKRGFFQTINPVNLFRSDSTPAAGAAVVSTNSLAVSRTPSAPGGPVGAGRYAYVSPPRPLPGNRAEAERSFAQALRAQQDHRVKDAVGLYRAAAQADPAFFDAQFNLGLAAFDLGDMPQSLLAYETALAIRPDSFNARFNFALALRKANYMQDAAQELERLLASPPAGEPATHLAMAHLTLGNIYAEQFHRPEFARPHYQKVLELDAQNSQATTIRYWLRDNP